MTQDESPADTPLAELLAAIAAAGARGASYQRITGVLAGCLATASTIPEARAIAIELLRRETATPARQQVA